MGSAIEFKVATQLASDYTAPMTTTDRLHDRMKRQGWSAGECGNTVYLTKGPHRIVAAGKTGLEAWRKAIEQARLLTMLGELQN
jgi:hypothetical protein